MKNSLFYLSLRLEITLGLYDFHPSIHIIVKCISLLEIFCLRLYSYMLGHLFFATSGSDLCL